MYDFGIKDYTTINLHFKNPLLINPNLLQCSHPGGTTLNTEILFYFSVLLKERKGTLLSHSLDSRCLAFFFSVVFNGLTDRGSKT